MKTSFLADHVTFLHHRYFVTGTFLDPTFNIILIPCKKSFRRRSNLGTSDKNQNKYIFSQNIVLRKLFSQRLFFRRKKSWPGLFLDEKKSPPRLFLDEKKSSPRLFLDEKKSLPRLFLDEKMSLPPFLPARPGVPINFARSLTIKVSEKAR